MVENAKYVIVGVVPGQDPAVLTSAAEVADVFDAELVCAWVDESRDEVGRDDSSPGCDVTIYAASIDPDLADTAPLELDAALRTDIARILDGTDVPYTVRARAGGAYRELTRLADELDAVMIVVGTRKPGFRGAMHEFFSGSVAVQLAHHQHRPVLVIPVNPVGLDEQPPWSDAH